MLLDRDEESERLRQYVDQLMGVVIEKAPQLLEELGKTGSQVRQRQRAGRGERGSFFLFYVLSPSSSLHSSTVASTICVSAHCFALRPRLGSFLRRAKRSARCGSRASGPCGGAPTR